MKIVLLLAGRGRRLGPITEKRNKCLIRLEGKPMLGHLVERFLFNGLDEIVPIIGYDAERVLNYLTKNFGKKIKLTPIFNPKYEVANNMYSLWCARSILDGDSFVLCNGDLILNKYIIKKLINSHDDSTIMLDIQNKYKDIDSPGTLIESDRILDIGRHISIKDNGGYAIGLYKFGSALSSIYFNKVKNMLDANMYQAGFHDPLITLLKSCPVYRDSTDGLSWTDIDEKEDIPKAQGLLKTILMEENHESV